MSQVAPVRGPVNTAVLGGLCHVGKQRTNHDSKRTSWHSHRWVRDQGNNALGREHVAWQMPAPSVWP